MKGLGDIYATLGRTTLAVQLQYRAELVIWLLGLVLQPVIYLVVWTTVTRVQGGTVGGMTAGDFAAYYILYMVINHLTFTWIMFEFEFRVRNGSFSPLLLQPLHPIHRDIVDNIAYKALTLTLTVPVAFLLAWVFEPTFVWQRWSLIAFIPALALAFLLRFMVEWSLALAAFWTTRVTALNEIYMGLAFFLSGYMAPLELMPDWVQTVAAVFPFRWMVVFPVELLLGRLTPDQALYGFAAQIVWLGLAFALISLVWSRGAKRYAAVGS
ncbi:MAG: ABC transporter permease [Candidatus Latescibacteria bacterium]|nr:ABC transporter permease [Candidatus Latescibacterota bacterium]